MTDPILPGVRDTGAPATLAATAPSAVESRHPRPILRIALEVLLISAGVFLGLAGDQWRENAEHRQLATATMKRFRTEVQGNRQSILAVQDYRVSVLRQLRAYLGADHKVRNTADVKLSGLRSMQFEETAWDLALATQSLAYLDDELAVKLSRVYTYQHRIAELNRGMLQAMYLIDLRENFDGFASAAEIYFSDLTTLEPQLARAYDDVLVDLTRHIGNEPPAAK